MVIALRSSTSSIPPTSFQRYPKLFMNNERIPVSPQQKIDGVVCRYSHIRDCVHTLPHTTFLYMHHYETGNRKSLAQACCRQSIGFYKYPSLRFFCYHLHKLYSSALWGIGCRVSKIKQPLYLHFTYDAYSKSRRSKTGVKDVSFDLSVYGLPLKLHSSGIQSHIYSYIQSWSIFLALHESTSFTFPSFPSLKCVIYNSQRFSVATVLYLYFLLSHLRKIAGHASRH